MEKMSSLNQLIDKMYPPISAKKEFEEGYKNFKLSVLLREARRRVKITQEELAKRINTQKSYISRVETNKCDIRLSTLRRMVEQGFGGKLIIIIELDKKEIKI